MKPQTTIAISGSILTGAILISFGMFAYALFNPPPPPKPVTTTTVTKKPDRPNVLIYPKEVFGKRIVEAFNAKVVNIVDGDTVDVVKLDDNTKVKIQLDSIAAPPPKQSFGTESKQDIRDLLIDKEVQILKTTVDKYLRTVAFVILNDTNVNAELVRRGNAWQHVQYSDDPDLASLEEQARQAKRGLWKENDPIPPWEFWKQNSKKQ